MEQAVAITAIFSPSSAAFLAMGRSILKIGMETVFPAMSEASPTDEHWFSAQTQPSS